MNSTLDSKKIAKVAIFTLKANLLGISNEEQIRLIKLFIEKNIQNGEIDFYEDHVISVKDNRKQLKKLMSLMETYDFIVFGTILALGFESDDIISNLYRIHSKVRFEIVEGALCSKYLVSNPIDALYYLKKERKTIRFKESIYLRKINGNQTNYSVGRPRKIDVKMEIAVTKLYQEGLSYSKISDTLGNISKSSVFRLISKLKSKGTLI